MEDSQLIDRFSPGELLFPNSAEQGDPMSVSESNEP